MPKYLLIACNADEEQMIVENVGAENAFMAVERFMEVDSRGKNVVHAEAYTLEHVRGWVRDLEA
jgi:hypothetical protein